MRLLNIDSDLFIENVLSLEKEQPSITACALIGLNNQAILKLIKSHIDRDNNVVLLMPYIADLDKLLSETDKKIFKITPNSEIPVIDSENPTEYIFDDHQITFFENDFPVVSTEKIKKSGLIIDIFDKIETTSKHTLIVIQEDFLSTSDMIKRIHAIHRRYKGATIVSLLSHSNLPDTTTIMANSNVNGITEEQKV